MNTIVVVDTNVVFSAVLNTNSSISIALLQPQNKAHFYSTNQLQVEIRKHHEKLRQLAKLTDNELDMLLEIAWRRIKLIDIGLVPIEIYKQAIELTSDIDPDDTEFIALTEYLNGKLWSGDHTLIKGLRNKGWDKFISLAEVQKLILS